ASRRRLADLAPVDRLARSPGRRSGHHAPEAVMKRRRRGFTLIEMLMVMVILGLLSALGLLKNIDLRATARTAALAADFRSVTVAALNHYADKDEWPPETGAGAVPAGLAPYLPG